MTAPRALSRPLFDAVAAGGAGLAAFVLLARIDPAVAAPWLARLFVPLSLLFNWPHFMASYHILYTTPGAVRRHPYAAVVVPAVLAAYALAATLLYGRWPWLLRGFHAASSVYLAWHYAGQTWGTMAAFAHVDGVRVEARARSLIRANLTVLLVWHAWWAAGLLIPVLGAGRFEAVYQALSAAAAVSAFVGAAGLLLLARGAGRLPPRVVLPWLVLHAGYAFLYRFPGHAYWVQVIQLAHAVQYLPFPLRVQANRDAAAGRGGAGWRPAAHYAALLAGGFIAFYCLPAAAGKLAGAAGLFPAGKSGLAGLAVLDFLVIHHYFVDGCIWRLGDPEVRRDLFAHLPPH